MPTQNVRYEKRKTTITDVARAFLEARMKASDAFFFEGAPTIGAEVDTSVIGFGPYEVLRDQNGVVEETIHGKTSRLDRPFFQALDEKLAALRCDPEPECRFLNGGAFGCIGYDAISDIESKLKESGYFKELAAAHRQHTHEPRAEILIAKKLIFIDHKNQTAHFIDGAPTERSIGVEEMEAILRTAEQKSTKSASSQTNGDASLDSDQLKPALGFEAFKARVEKIKDHVRAGDIFQAVLAERFEYPLKADPIDVFLHLRRINPAPYSFYFSFQDREFFGASPEALIRIEGRTIVSHPIAGTRRRGRTAEEDRKLARSLLRSRKEAAEHLMLVDLARNDLGRVATPGSVRVRAFRSLRYLSNVMHLVSEVEAELKEGVSALEALKACFPAGTLSGAPKIRAMEILAGLEPVPRGLYGGAVVAFDSVGQLDSCIAIRSLETRERTAVLRAGAGIVADSRPEHEYAEVSHKLRAIREAIAMAERELEHGAAHRQL